MPSGRSSAAAADPTTMLLFRADAHRTLAEVLGLAGDGAGANRAAEQALQLYEAKGVAVATAAMGRDGAYVLPRTAFER
jgi:hypothetical protein